MDSKTQLARLIEEVLSGKVSPDAAVESANQMGKGRRDDLLDEVYHHLIHYREDQDIRAVDERYAERQRRGLMALLARLRS